LSFGTEGRAQSPQQEMPPQPNVFPLIVFKGSDVKDLKVEESQQQQQLNQQQQQWGGYGYPQQQYGFPQYGTPPPQQNYGGPQYWQSPNQPHVSQMPQIGQMHQPSAPLNQGQLPPGMNNGQLPPGMNNNYNTAQWGYSSRPQQSPAQAAATSTPHTLQKQINQPINPTTSTPDIIKPVETITFGKVGVWDNPQKSQLALQVNNTTAKKINLEQVRANSGRGDKLESDSTYIFYSRTRS
jgi:Scd6-like Sm domain